ncbi:MAG: efflux RND transporter permease subunit [Bacteroidales bacterium]|nr:efflux RND transporter permease subunit [Bacteroidales bacterium]
MMAGTEGLINIENQINKTKTDIYVNINKDKANYFGVPVHEIEKTIRACMAGAPVSKFRDSEGNDFQIVLRLPVRENPVWEDFDKIFVKSLSGKFIPLKQLAVIEFRESPGILFRKGLARTATLISDIKKGFTLNEVLDPVVEQLEKYPFPKGYSYHLGGELENRQESFGGMMKAIFITVLAIFSVLVFQFRSIKQSLVMFAAIPLGFIGSIWALFLTGNTFSFTAFIGLISLVGIVINNSIILVDYTNTLIKQGKPQTEAIQIAGETRFTPIILTTLTTIGGLLPLTLGGVLCGRPWAGGLSED